MISKEQLKKLKGWAGFIGIVSIVAGLTVIGVGGLTEPLVIIPGFFLILSGFNLLSIRKKAAEVFVANIDNPYLQINRILALTNTYLILQGILVVCSLAFGLYKFFG